MDSTTLMGAHLVVTLALTAVNVLAGQRRFVMTARRDGRRLALALRAELQELQLSLAENQRRVRGGVDYLVSTRACLMVYKGNLGRVTGMPDGAIAATVRAYALSERAEFLIAATTKAHGSMGYRIQEETPLADIGRKIQYATHAVRDAIAALEVELGPSPAEAPAEQPGPGLAPARRG